jgi:EAL domain-containing protein (putative c-di-GMP-specific phosphodiesterase class I)
MLLPGAAGPAVPAHSLRVERDRFVALAFCWADVLLELDPAGKVLYAAGPSLAVLGAKPETLLGRPIEALVDPAEVTLLRQLLALAARHGRIENVTARFRTPHGPTLPLALAGYRLDELGGHYFLALRTGAPPPKSAKEAPLVREPHGGLYDAESFSRLAGERLAAAHREKRQARMTLLALPNYDDLRQRLDEDAHGRLLSTVGACLRAHSVDGDSAGHIADGRYGLIHDVAVDVGRIENQVAEFAREADPARQPAKVETATVHVDPVLVSQEDLARGLVYTINRFRDAKGRDFSIKNLSTNLSSLVSQAMTTVNSFKKVVEASDFDVVFQPIVDVATGRIHHYEALARFHTARPDESPYEYITFAEETGLIWDFDIAMARKVLVWIEGLPAGTPCKVAVNISGSSVGTLTYVAELHKLLRAKPWARERLLFEITESSRMGDLATANKFIQSLRGEGYEVCLDDFGAGAANFQYLSLLEVDVVKLDGSAVRNAQRGHKGRAFLMALTGLCRHLGVATIAEMVDDEKGLTFVRDCGVEYVQGYLFGRPDHDIAAFDLSPFKALFPDWQGG